MPGMLIKDSAYWHKRILEIEKRRNCADSPELEIAWRATMDAWKAQLATELELLKAQVAAAEFRDALTEDDRQLPILGS